MLNRDSNKIKKFVVFAVLLLVIPIGFSTVTLTDGTVIEQEDNDAEIVVDEEFNTSELSVFDSATEFGGTNISLIHDNTDLIHANMSEFSADAEAGETLTDFSANASSGDNLDIQLSNLTRRMYYRIYVDGLGTSNESSEDSGEYSYSLDYDNNEFRDFEIRAEAQDTFDNVVDFSGDLTYDPNQTVTVSGSGDYEISEDPVDGGTVDILREGSLIDNTTTDSNGEYSADISAPKEAGTHNYDVNMSQHHLFDSESREIVVDSLFMEDASVESLDTSGQFIDIDTDGALNISTKVYRNLENDIETVRYTIHEDPDSPPIQSTFEPWAQLENTTSASETGVWYNETPKLSDKEGIGLGNYTVKLQAESELADGIDINVANRPEFNISIQDLDMNLETDQESYSVNNDDTVNVTGRVVRQPDEEPVSDTTVDISVYDNDTGDSLNVGEATTNSTGHYNYEYSFSEDSGTRMLTATTADDNGIDGNESVEFTVTELTVDSIGFSDSEVAHAYNVSSVVSDSREISNHQCSLTVSDDAGNSEDYSMDIDTSYGSDTEAFCLTPDVGYENNSEWGPEEELSSRVEVENGSAYAADTATRSLPNTAPDVTEFTVEEVDKEYGLSVDAVAEDPNKNESEIEACKVYYYDSSGNEYVEEGNLDTGYGVEDEASCEYSLTSSMEGIDENEDIDVSVEFEDQQGATGMSENRTGSVEASLSFDAEILKLNGEAPGAEIEFREPGTNNVVSTLEGDDTNIVGSVDKGVYDMNIKTVDSEIQYNDAEIEEDTSFTLYVQPDVDTEYDDEVSTDWARTYDHISVSDMGLNYTDATIRFDYSGLEEKYVTPWECETWNEDPDFRDCRQESFPYDSLNYNSAGDFDLNPDTNKTSINTDTAEGAYVLAANRGWREDWFERKEITVEGGSEDTENYQVKFTVDTQTLIQNEELDDECSSIRMYNTDQNEELDHWMEPGTCDSNETAFWVEMPYLPANAERTIFLYHGDKELEPTSSGEDTFIDFDEFNSDTVSNYETSGRVSVEDGMLELDAKDGEQASARFNDDLETPYRSHATLEADTDSESAFVGTQDNGTDRVEFDLVNSQFRESFTGEEASRVIDTDGMISINQSVTDDVQRATVQPDGTSIELNGNMSSGMYSPFVAGVNESDDLYSSVSVERWFATNYIEEGPEIKDKSDEDLWTLKLNGTDGDINVPLDTVIDIELNSSDYKSEVSIFREGEEVADSEGDGVEGILFRDDQLNERKTYEINGIVERFDENITRYITVGQDEIDPNVSLMDKERIDTNEMNFTYEVAENYQGSTRCEMIIDGEVKDASRLDFGLNNDVIQDYFYIDDAPHGTNSYNISCTDNSDNLGSNSSTYDQDFKAPRINFENLQNGQTVWQVRPRVEFELVDDYSESLDYTVYYDYDNETNVSGTASNATSETVTLPETEVYDTIDLVIEATDDKNQTRTDEVTIDLNKPFVDLIEPEEGDEERRTIHNPSSSGNEEVLPETRYQTDNPDITYRFNYTNDQMSSTQCRAIVDGEEYDSGEFDTNTPQEFDLTLDEGINQETFVECQTETGTWVSGGSADRNVDVDYTEPEMDGIIFEEANESVYTEDKEHEVKFIIEDNLMSPQTNDTISDKAYGYGRLQRECGPRDTSTVPNPFLETNGTDNGFAVEHNFTDEYVNETFTLERESYLTGVSASKYDCDWRSGSEPKDFAVENFGSLTPGRYDFQAWIQDEVGNSVETQNYTYRIYKGDPGLAISSDNDRASNDEIVRYSSPEIRCSAVTDQVSTVLERNGLEVDDADEGETTLEDNSELPTGTYEYECSTEGNENFTEDVSTRTIEVVDYMPDDVNISFNGSYENTTIVHDDVVEIDYKSRSGNDNLQFDGSDVDAPLNVSYLDVGNYTVFGDSSGSYRFNESNKTRNLEVVRAKNDVQLGSNFSINRVMKKNTPLSDFSENKVSLINAVRGERPELQCTSETDNAEMNVTRDGTTVHTATGNTTYTVNTSKIDEGFYRFNCESNESQNYNPGSDGVYMDVQISPAPTFPESDDENIDGSPGDTVFDSFDFSNDRERNIERGTTVDVTCEANEDVPSSLTFEGEDVGTADTRTLDETGNYDYRCQTEETEDYRAIDRTLTYDVMNRTETELQIDGSTDDLTVDQGEEVEVVGESNVSDTLVELRDGRTDETRFWADNSGLAEKTHSFEIPGEHEITAFHPEEDDYFESSDSSTVTVRDVNAPEIELLDPNDEEIWEHNSGRYDDNDFNIRYRSRDYSPHTCTLDVNGTSGWDSSEGTNDDYEWDRKVETLNRPSGVYEYSVTCEDEHGNSAQSETREFRLDSQDPEITVNEEGLVETGDPSPGINVTTTDVSSREAKVEFYANSSLVDPEESYRDEYLDGGMKIGESTGDLGQRVINTDQLSPGLYNVSARAIDEVGRDDIDYDVYQLRILDNITVMDPEDSTEDGRTYVNTSNPELSFKYYSEQAPLTCDVRLDGNLKQTFPAGEEGNDEDTWINNTVNELGQDDLSEGSHTWEVTCGTENEDTFSFDSEFYVDTTNPDFDYTQVNPGSGDAFTGDDVKFDTQANDNFEIDTVEVTTASNLTTTQMFCNEQNQCTADVDLEPGDHNYNYTACDKAGNCETTETSAYELLDESNSMNLYLNDEEDNITITENPIVNITGEFIEPKEGTVYFYINDSLEGRCDSGDGCTIEENFLSPNGTYKVDAEFYSTSDFTTNNEQFWINAQVPENEFAGYFMRNLPSGKNASLRDNPGRSVMANPVIDTQEVLLGNGVGENLAAQLSIDFANNVDASDINFDTDKGARKSYLHLERTYGDVIRKDILVPRVENTGEVTVCPGATSLEEVSYTCTDGYNISTGETVGATTMEEVTINGEKYYEVRGVTGTGGQEVSSEDESANSPSQADVDQINVLEEYQANLPTEDDLDLDGGNVSSASLSTTQSTDNWAGLYGNATGELILGSENVLYSWEAEPVTVLAANDTVDWSLLQTATPEGVDDYYGMEGDSDNAVNTLTDNTTIEVSGTEFEDAPSTKSLNGSETPLWTTGALSDSETPVIAGKTLNNESTAFTGEIVNYQMMVPTGGDFVVPYSMYLSLD